MLGRMCSTEMRVGPLPDGARREDVVERPERQGPAAGDAGEDGDVEDADGQDRVGGRRPVARGDQDGDHEAGEGEDQVVAAHDDLVEEAPPVGGGGKAQRHAEADADPHRDHRHGDGGLRADHQHREHVAAKLIGAEHVGRAGRPAGAPRWRPR
jgi:hypothetical protein